MCVHMFCVCVHKCIIIVVVVVIYVYGVNVIFLLFYRGIVVDQEFWSVPALFKVFTPIVLYAIMCAVFSTIYLYSVKVIMHQKKKKSFTRKYLIKLILGHCAITYYGLQQEYCICQWAAFKRQYTISSVFAILNGPVDSLDRAKLESCSPMSLQLHMKLAMLFQHPF